MSSNPVQRLLLRDLPPPPPQKVGWPWTEETGRLQNAIPDVPWWPKISIVTPSYNQAQFLEETIRSVLLQGYPNLEYIVMDGGSNDGSTEIIRKYARWLVHWTSEKDEGQADAINKGFARCTGNLLGWINSDDLLLPGALDLLARTHLEHPAAILAGDVVNFCEGEQETELIRQRDISFRNMIVTPRDMKWHQPGVFVPSRLAKQVGILDKSLRYFFDQDWMCRLLLVAPVHYLRVPVAKFRLHSRSKTVGEARAWPAEEALVRRRYIDRLGKRDRRAVIAELEMRGAVRNLDLEHWDRRRGLQNLLRVFCAAPGNLCSERSVRLLARGLVPLSVLRNRARLIARRHATVQDTRDEEGVAAPLEGRTECSHR
jgi:glycosyltransferase involved in cell wall biosynthesis